MGPSCTHKFITVADRMVSQKSQNVHPHFFSMGIQHVMVSKVEVGETWASHTDFQFSNNPLHCAKGPLVPFT